MINLYYGSLGDLALLEEVASPGDQVLNSQEAEGVANFVDKSLVIFKYL